MTSSVSRSSQEITRVGVPDLTLAGLQVWIHNREFPNSIGSFDGDWLVVTVHCGGKGADVWAQGSIIHLSEIASFLKQVELMSNTFKGQAEFCYIEPNFSARMDIGKRGDISLIVEITPDHLAQQHKFIYDIDQSYLSPLVRDLKTILEKYPIKDRKA